MLLVGSEPMDKKQISGTLGSLSAQVASRLRMTASAYLAPIESAMYMRAWAIVRSGHQDLRQHMNDNLRAFLIQKVQRYPIGKMSVTAQIYFLMTFICFSNCILRSFTITCPHLLEIQCDKTVLNELLYYLDNPEYLYTYITFCVSQPLNVPLLHIIPSEF